jgi:hypothetical protein
MCGLVGLINKNSMGFTRQQQDVFAELLFIDMLRGQDSTGVFVVSNTGDVFGAKDALNSVDFMQTKEFDESFKRAFSSGSAMIGHNRKATRGEVNSDNAHPFVVDNNIILVHNGTMMSDHKKFANVEVDSHAIAHLIHEKESVEEALSSFHGAYALIWYDVKNASINMIRNSQRPLWWMESHSSWVWSSEKAMLDFIIERNGMYRSALIHEPTELPEDVLQTFKLEDKKWIVSSKKLDIKSPTSYYSGYGSGGSRAMRRFQDDDGWEEFERSMACAYPLDRTPAQRHKPVQQQPQHHVIGPGNIAQFQRNRSLPLIAEPPEFAGHGMRERNLCKRNNKVTPYGEYGDRLISKNHYPYNATVIVTPFDYLPVNGKDDSDGWYIYSSPVDGDSVVFRQWITSANITEEQVIQIAGCGYVYEYVVGAKFWSPFSIEIGEYGPDHPGCCIIKSQHHRLLHRGLEDESATVRKHLTH